MTHTPSLIALLCLCFIIQCLIEVFTWDALGRGAIVREVGIVRGRRKEATRVARPKINIRQVNAMPSNMKMISRK